MMNKGPIRKILTLAANPQDTGRLRLDAEVREIKEGLKRSAGRDRFEVFSEWAVQPDDLRRALLDHNPHIVHFSGHGGGAQGLALDDGKGRTKLVQARALSELFQQFTCIDCVLFNACYSEVQAKALAHVNYVIGMVQALGDDAAIKFAMGFYDGLFGGCSYEKAYAFGKNAIDLEGIPETQTPVLSIYGREQGANRLNPQAGGPNREQICLQIGKELDAEKTVLGKRIFISYRDQSPDAELAADFFQALQAEGHVPFIAGGSTGLGEAWAKRISTELEQCDYMLLLLSPESAMSEMVTEEVRRARQLRSLSQGSKPVILPVRVRFPFGDSLNYDLWVYLENIQQYEWRTQADTPALIAELLSLIADTTRDVSTQPEDWEQAPSWASVPNLTPRLDKPPSPIAPPELPEGQVDIVSAYYVERPPIEQRCYDTILSPGALIRIKAPRQMGKTSLMARILGHAAKHDCITVPLSFQLADDAIFSDLEKFLQWFCASITSELELPDRLSEFWKPRTGCKMSCTNYFERFLLKELTQPLVLGLDEVDLVFKRHAIAADFFGLLRAWHEKTKNKARWKKLRLIVVHSTEVYIPLDVHESPFNVGLPLELPEFSVDQVLDLAHRHGLLWKTHDVEQLMAIVGGHPYLIRQALYDIANQDLTLATLLETGFTDAGLYGDHLRRHWWNLTQHGDLIDAMKKVVVSARPARLEPVQAFQLESMGLVRWQGNDVIPRFDLYRRYFRERLIG